MNIHRPCTDKILSKKWDRRGRPEGQPPRRPLRTKDSTWNIRRKEANWKRGVFQGALTSLRYHIDCRPVVQDKQVAYPEGSGTIWVALVGGKKGLGGRNGTTVRAAADGVPVRGGVDEISEVNPGQPPGGTTGQRPFLPRAWTTWDRRTRCRSTTGPVNDRSSSAEAGRTGGQSPGQPWLFLLSCFLRWERCSHLPRTNGEGQRKATCPSCSAMRCSW